MYYLQWPRWWWSSFLDVLKHGSKCEDKIFRGPNLIPAFTERALLLKKNERKNRILRCEPLIPLGSPKIYYPIEQKSTKIRINRLLTWHAMEAGYWWNYVPNHSFHSIKAVNSWLTFSPWPWCRSCLIRRAWCPADCHA